MAEKQNKKSKIIVGVVVVVFIVVLGGIIENSANNSSSPTADNIRNQLPSATQPAPTTAPQPMQVQGGTVIADGNSYTLLPISELKNSGSFAAEGRIMQVIPNPITKGHTPYYFIIQNNGDYAVVGVLVPAGEEQNFDPNIFPVGTNILAAGVIFPFSNQAGVFNYSTFIQATDVVPAIRQLNLPPATPVITANFQDMEVMR